MIRWYYKQYADLNLTKIFITYKFLAISIRVFLRKYISWVFGVKVSKSFKENFEGLYLFSFHKN